METRDPVPLPTHCLLQGGAVGSEAGPDGDAGTSHHIARRESWRGNRLLTEIIQAQKSGPDCVQWLFFLLSYTSFSSARDTPSRF